MREVCGAVSGMFMAAGLKFGYTSPVDKEVKAEHYARIQELAKVFKAKHDTIICRELLGVDADDNPVPSPRTKEYYETRPCEQLVADAADIFAEYLSKQASIKS